MNICNYFCSLPLKDSQAQNLIRLGDIDQVMWDTAQFLRRGFCSAYIHAPVKETGIGRDDFAIESFY